MDYKTIIESIFTKVKSEDNPGKLADYIPELAKVNPENFGVYLFSQQGESCGVGDFEERFSIQSISKVFSLTLAFKLLGEKIWKRLGVEPSGTAFNSLVQLESDNGIPRNPFINAGALVIADILVSELENPREDFLQFCRHISQNKNLNFSDRVAESEKSVGYRNVALCNFIKSFGNITNEPEEVLDFYYYQCSLEMSCKELAEAFQIYPNGGRILGNDEQIITLSQAKRINAIMQTCGLYDESGEFSFEVGLPGKSGVSGAIVAVHPGQYTIAVWSPLLNKKGNSYRGMKFLERFTTETQSSIF